MATYDMIVNGDFISSVVKGPLSVDDFKQITDDMLELCKEHGIRKVLIDVMKTAGTFSDEDSEEFAIYASNVLKYNVDRYAYVYPHELLTYKSQFVAQGRGLYVRAFYNIDDALEWIEKN